MTEYDITEAFRAIEKELIESMIRNMDRHRAEETEEGMEWSMWQAEQLKSLEKYKRENQEKYKKQFRQINKEIDVLIRSARERGNMEQEIRILEAIKKGFKGGRKVGKGAAAEFFRLNDRKLEALIKATTEDMEKAEAAVLRKANDDYRKAIFNAQVYANTGAGTYEKAVDMATKDMLSRGLNCIVYANGARHTLADYADMAIRTASKRAYLQGEGEKRQEWGIATVIVNKRGNPCPKCLPFCGKVLIDDVWSGGSKNGVDPETGKRYPLMSKAIEYGLYHPRCKDSHTTYFPGISTADDTWTEKELETIRQVNRQEAKQQYAERQEAKYERLKENSLDPQNQKNYKVKAAEWGGRSEGEERGVNIKKSHADFLARLREDQSPDAHKSRMALYAEATQMLEDAELPAPFAYIPDLDVIKYNPKAPHIGDYDMDYVFAHETSHRMDELEYHSWENEKFLQAIEICAGKVYDQREKVQNWFEPGGKYEQSFAISDIISALTNGEIAGMVGHSEAYWSEPGLRAMELFADISAADILKLPEKEELRGLLNELFKAYEEMVR